MRLSAFRLFAVCASLMASAAPAEEARPVVVELFTSQGCSSCPPADALLHELGQRDDVIALALHVDYWDYIGWKDSFAEARFTERQKGYATAAGRTSIYTPQMVVNGVHDVVGNRPKDVAKLIEKHRAKASPVTLDIAREGEMLRIAADTTRPVGPVHVYLVRYDPEESVRIKRGENAGKRLTYSYIVTDWDVVGIWDGTAPYLESVPLTGAEPAVVLVQQKGYGAVLAAARLR
ncbi:DUF1223 domain-containing protein [Roseivivax isoporae]|uniref:DUF1223 domain-containing protein n=1 Tax=Roseivivax isoporae LMG 25204 TaxID=1449351 RepID=X7FCW2_9RHOB|nr:DUF1223 domain-containing protein [Roseivivax isoporae]ETX30655.1 hypothetical protein RISW2_07520 [Roseivivax isoporae LMG 25204]